MRAVLFAIATVASRGDLRSSSATAHGSTRSGLTFICLRRAVIPVTNNRLTYRSPIFEIRPSRSLPPLDRFKGVRPSQAANSRPFRNRRPSPAVATPVEQEPSTPSAFRCCAAAFCCDLKVGFGPRVSSDGLCRMSVQGSSPVFAGIHERRLCKRRARAAACQAPELFIKSFRGSPDIRFGISATVSRSGSASSLCPSAANRASSIRP